MKEEDESYVPESDPPICRLSLSTAVKWCIAIAMIGLLPTLLLPYLQYDRNASRGRTCTRNLKQIGLAYHNYHDTFKRLPASSWSSTDGFGWSWLTYLLPYMGEEALFDSLDVQNAPPTTDTAMTARPKVFVCPNYTGPAFVADGRGGITNYKAIGATTKASLALYDTTTNASAPYATPKQHPDSACFPGRPLRVSGIADGLSNTLLAAETVEQKAAVWQDGKVATLVGLPNSVNEQLVQPDDPQSSEHYSYYHFTGYIAGQYGERSAISPSIRTYLGWDYGGVDGAYENAAYVYGVSSEHPGVVNHLFCDGGVCSISTEVDTSLYWFITTRRGGDPGSEFFSFYP